VDFFTNDPGMQTAPRELLDVCCGTGQLARRFLEQGYVVVGIDLSPHMLEYAVRNNQKAVDEGRARFLVGDASAFELEEPVSFAVSLFDSLNHLPDVDALGSCFSCAWDSLRSPGMFVFDLNTPTGLERSNGINVQDSEEITIINRGIYAPGAERAFTSITGFIRNADGTYERFSERAYNTVFKGAEVLGLLRKAGFSECYVAASSDLSEAVEEPDELDRAFFVCRKD